MKSLPNTENNYDHLEQMIDRDEMWFVWDEAFAVQIADASLLDC